MMDRRFSNKVIHFTLPVRARINHRLGATESQGVFDSLDYFTTRLTAVVSPGGVPLPSFDQPYSLRDNAITYFARAAKQFVVKSDVGASPDGILPTSDSEGIPFNKIPLDV